MKRADVLLLLMFASGAAYGPVQVISLPALDEGGLIALIGVVGGIVARHHKK